MPLIPAQKTQRQEDLCEWGSCSEFQDSQDYTEKPFVDNTTTLQTPDSKGNSMTHTGIIILKTDSKWVCNVITRLQQYHYHCPSSERNKREIKVQGALRDLCADTCQLRRSQLADDTHTRTLSLR